jgi:hypothetical protein
MHSTVDDLLIKARRSVRHRRIATVTTAVVTTAVVIGGVATWSTTRPQSEGPAGHEEPSQTVTIDTKTGRVVDSETGKTIAPPPPVSPLSDAEVLSRCKQFDRENVDFLREHKANAYDKAGPIDARWKVVVKSGDQSRLNAMFLAPDRSIVATCTMSDAKRVITNGRISTTEVMPYSGNNLPQAVEAGLWVPVPGAARVIVEGNHGDSPLQALVGSDGFYSLGVSRSTDLRVDLKRIRAYDAAGKKIWELVMKPPVLPSTSVPPVDPSVTIKTIEPITPVVELTKDPASGKALATTPVSLLSDDQVRDRCALWEHEINTNPVYGESGREKDPRDKAAGPITQSWSVALKTGTGDKLTALLVSPDRKVLAWCHMTKPAPKGGENDWTRGAVKADGTFGNPFEWGMVPKGVAQIVVDLPKFGPTRALISNGFYIWGVTGGNSDIQTVRVRGFDAQGKQVYDVKKQVDAS